MPSPGGRTPLPNLVTRQDRQHDRHANEPPVHAYTLAVARTLAHSFSIKRASSSAWSVPDDGRERSWVAYDASTCVSGLWFFACAVMVKPASKLIDRRTQST